MSERQTNTKKRSGLIPLQGGYVYGPIASRRLGNSLGVNPFPLGKKICTFNCIYCQYGWTPTDLFSEPGDNKDFPGIETVRESLRIRMVNLKEIGIDLQYITFAGNGEPTLYPDFPKLVDAVIQMRDEHYPDAKTAILSNSTHTSERAVAEGLNKLDVRIMKLDVGSEDMLKKINRPMVHCTLEQIIDGLQRLKSCTLQSLFIEGTTSNCDDRSVGEWIRAVQRIGPEFVQVYSIDRVPADRGLGIVGKERLKEIAKRLKEETGIESEVY